jgi:Methylase of polypeptide chain release factors
MALKEKYNDQRTDEFYADCKRLILGEPLAYLIGWTPYLECKIHLDSKPLIPRPETEYWTEQAIESMGTRTTSLNLPYHPISTRRT